MQCILIYVTTPPILLTNHITVWWSGHIGGGDGCGDDQEAHDRRRVAEDLRNESRPEPLPEPH